MRGHMMLVSLEKAPATLNSLPGWTTQNMRCGEMRLWEAGQGEEHRRINSRHVAGGKGELWAAWERGGVAGWRNFEFDDLLLASKSY